VLEALVQPPKNVEDKDAVFNGRAGVGETVGHSLELAAVLKHREVALNKVTKDSVKMKSTLLTVAEKLVRAAPFLDHLVKLR
jgi:hypothetical protein